MLGAAPDAEVARRLGRSLGAVYTRRHNLGVPGFLLPVDAAALRRLRVAAGLTQEGLAAAAGVHARKPRQLESGRDRTARRDELARLAAALGVGPEAITSKELGA